MVYMSHHDYYACVMPVIYNDTASNPTLEDGVPAYLCASILSSVLLLSILLFILIELNVPT